jgi:hypothetical protein
MPSTATAPHNSDVFDDISDINAMDNRSCCTVTEVVNPPATEAQQDGADNCGGREMGIFKFAMSVLYRMYLVAKSVAVYPLTPTDLDFETGEIRPDCPGHISGNFKPAL